MVCPFALYKSETLATTFKKANEQNIKDILAKNRSFDCTRRQWTNLNFDDIFGKIEQVAMLRDKRIG